MTTYASGFTDGWNKGWEAHESFIEQKAMERDPAFLSWLDKLDRLARLQRERDELNLQQQQMAAQATDDTLNH